MIKLIQIDDAGSGSLIGGTLIGLIRVETLESYFMIIPLEFYNEKNFKQKNYLKYAQKIVIDGLNYLKLYKNEEINICQGYMFDNIRNYMNNNCISFKSTKIEDPLQSIIEKEFERYAISLGLPENFTKYTKYPLHFHRLLRWVYSDYENRISLCKTGWKSFNKYGKLDLQIYNDKIDFSNYYCLKCGKKIRKNSRVKIIKYYSNMPNTIYIHEDCNLQTK